MIVREPLLDDKLTNKVAGYLGLAQKAGKIAAGDLAVINAIKNDSARLIITALDSAPSVKAALEKEIGVKTVPVYLWGQKVFLGTTVGKSSRGALAVLDKGFADAIEKVFLG